MTTAQVIAGTKAKLTGHKNEQMICDWLNQSRGGSHVVDGRSQTKRDIINEEESLYNIEAIYRFPLNLHQRHNLALHHLQYQ